MDKKTLWIKKKLMIDIDKVLTRLGITDLNEMQQKTTAAILGTDNDVVVLSPTGSGKTLAYLLPVAHEIDTESDDVQVVVIVPGANSPCSPTPSSATCHAE